MKSQFFFPCKWLNTNLHPKQPGSLKLRQGLLFNTSYKGTTTVRHHYMIGLELRPRPKTRDPKYKVFSLDYQKLDSQLS